MANQGSCSGGGRGLCCGCKSDSQCGDSTTQGCGGDSATNCCYGRPNVKSTSPANEQDKVCRNGQLIINFDQLMKPQTLMSNILLVEEKDYGTGTCQNGTTLSLNTNSTKPTNIFARLYEKVANGFKSIFNRSDYRAIAAGPSPDKLYCITPIVVETDTTNNSGSTSTVAYVKPQRILDAKSNYFVIVKGDENLDSNSGVISDNKIGLNGSLTSPIKNAQFNGASFKNSYTYGFTTMDDKSGKNGLCTVSRIVSSPSSFLIKTTDNDVSDDNPDSASFDTKSDSDRVVTAFAYSSDNQLLQPVTGYFWNWRFNIEDTSVVKNLNTVGLKPNKIVVGAISGVTDKSTKIDVNADMSNFSSASGCVNNCTCSGANCSNKCCNASFDGDGVRASSDVYVFLCSNPWPMEIAGNWNPWADKCTDASGKLIPKCTDYNYKFYYCRDAGDPGTADDLPAVMDPALILGSSNLICSSNGASCATQNEACGNGGTCIWNILKESYFFREAIPQTGEITEVKSTGAGGQIAISWYIPVSASAPVTSFKVYYGLTDNDSSLTVAPLTLKEASCNIADGKNYCSYLVNKLTDGKEYYFKVSSLTAQKAESPLSGTKNIIPTDTTAPARPIGLKASLVGGKIEISWPANTDDTLYYRLGHGLFEGKVADSVDSPNNATSLELDKNNYRSGDHFFYLAAIDKSGNVSSWSDSVKINILSAPSI